MPAHLVRFPNRHGSQPVDREHRDKEQQRSEQNLQHSEYALFDFHIHMYLFPRYKTQTVLYCFYIICEYPKKINNLQLESRIIYGLSLNHSRSCFSDG